MIVKTDLELNKAQEELDRRLNSLDALQKTSRLISTTLDEDEIFQRLDKSFMTEFGFERNLILIYDDKESKMLEKANLGYSQDDIQKITTALKSNSSLLTGLREGHTFSSVNCPKQRAESIIQIFYCTHFIFSPILKKDGLMGIIYVGNRSNTASITEGDEELVAILATQIGQSLENARLFEQVFNSSQDLESKVQNRTKQLATALEEVQHISKTKTEFISAVSHELRTPLTSIKGYASLLMTGKLGEIPEKVKDRLNKINTHSDNLVGLINNLLDISRIESGRVEMNIAPANIRKIIDEVGDLLTPQMKEKNIQWKTEIDDKIQDMMLDTSQVERIFINLVGNAIKFTPEAGTIGVNAMLKDNDTVEFEVYDTGIGISQEDLKQLFDEFYRVENQINQNVKGTGLGLPLAKKIVEAHEGNMWVTSELNKGTAFHFTLPIEQKVTPDKGDNPNKQNITDKPNNGN